MFLKLYLSGSKIGINAFAREGLCTGGGLIRGVTQMLRKGWTYLRGGAIREKGAYRQRNTVLKRHFFAICITFCPFIQNYVQIKVLVMMMTFINRQ